MVAAFSPARAGASEPVDTAAMGLARYIGQFHVLRPGGLAAVRRAKGSRRLSREARVHSHLEFHKGQYILNGCVNHGGLTLSVYGNFERGNATAIQNGGTNLGPIYVGGDVGGGIYTLSNGVVQAPVIALDVGEASGGSVDFAFGPEGEAVDEGEGDGGGDEGDVDDDLPKHHLF